MTVTCAWPRACCPGRRPGWKGHHYALVTVDGLAPGSSHGSTRWPSTDAPVWPDPDVRSSRPPVIRDDPTGSGQPEWPTGRAAPPCPTTGGATAPTASMPCAPWRSTLRRGRGRAPRILAFLGDQVYADETSEAMREFIASSARPRLSHRVWRSRTTRSTPTCTGSPGATRRTGGCSPPLPTCNDLRRPRHPRRLEHLLDLAGRRSTGPRGGTSAWMGGLASYWVYQHLGNLSPAPACRGRGLCQGLWAHEGRGRELDLTEAVFDLVRRVRTVIPTSIGGANVRDLGDSRLVVVDSRAARVLQPKASIDARPRRDGVGSTSS